MRATLLTVSFALLAALTPLTASARPEFPDSLQSATGAPCVPQCNICHESVSGGGPADQPFAKSLLQMGGLQGPGAMEYDVSQLEHAGVDSDGDGVGDIAEIRAGTDPNYAGDALICQPDVGCGAHVAPEPPNDGLAASFAMLTALGLVFLRRRSGAPGVTR
jgi:hypothetical protein